MIPKLVRDTINKLTEQLKVKEEYIKVLEDKIDNLTQKLYDIEKGKTMEKAVEEAIVTHSVEEGLKKMGIEAEDLTELSDLLDEVLEEENNKEEDER